MSTHTNKQQSWDTLKQDEAAEYLHVPLSTMKFGRLHERGPKSFVLGGRIRYLRADLDAYLAAAYAQAVGDETPQAS